MSVSLPRNAAGALPVFWRAALFAGVLSVHGLGFALVPGAGTNGQEKARGPKILQASWIAAAGTPTPMPIAPEPVAAPKPSVKPEKTKPKPLLTRQADAPEPMTQTVAAFAPSLPEEASASAPDSGEHEARDAPATGGVPAAGEAGDGKARAEGEAGQGSAAIPPSHADYLSNARPDYPSASRAQGEQGVVSLFIHVNAEGKTSSVALHRTSGYARLDLAAMEVVWRWRFIPARQNGRPVAGTVIVPIRFKLRS
ncbi:MAG: energy transducer TonB [Zoogloeaceae bacterium]|jgi:protein TonB|nr:energy transducer TonB [Zoogloeaceae bacterium]